MSHEWPEMITYKDQLSQKSFEFLVRKKGFLKNEILNENLGARCLNSVMENLMPDVWMSAHLHVKFNSEVKYQNNLVTQFIALSKPKPGKQNGFKSDPYMDILQVSIGEDKKVEI